MNRAQLFDRGVAEYQSGALAAAAATFSEILSAAPRDAEALSNLAAVLNAAQCPEAAEAACRAALSAAPEYWAALANLGDALHRQNRLEDAVATYLAAVNANPANAAAWTNLGQALAGQWRMEGALIAHDAALRLAPDDPEVRTNRAMALLAAGRYAEGFAEYEWRWKCRSTPHHGITSPLWLGEEARDKTILLHEEGGFGDTLHFVRFAPLVSQRGRQIVLRVQEPLRRLVHRSFPEIDAVIPNTGAPPAHHLHCPMMSLPHALGMTMRTIAGSAPYLAACPDAALAWRGRLDAMAPNRLRVGLVWAGAPRLGMAQARAMNARRSIPPTLLAPLAAVPGILFVSLQAGIGETAPAAGLDLFDPMPQMQDFDDTAALVAALDLVISVDSAVAHLAGGLGRPVWLLSRHDACWRWLAGRTDSPWYPTLRLYRQPLPGDWGSVIATVASDLAGLTKTYEGQRHYERKHPSARAFWPAGPIKIEGQAGQTPV